MNLPCSIIKNEAKVVCSLTTEYATNLTPSALFVSYEEERKRCR